MLLFSLPNINPHLSVCSNSGLPQPVYFADRLSDRTGEQDAERVCITCRRCHILDCCTSFFTHSRRVLKCLLPVKGNALAHGRTPNRHPRIYQRQDKTHLIWTSNSLFTHSQQVKSFRFTLGRLLCYTNTHTPTIGHSLGSFFTDVAAN